MKNCYPVIRPIVVAATILLGQAPAYAQHQITQFYPQNGADNDAFGSSVAISGPRFVVGAEDIKINNLLRAGSVYLFETSQAVQLFQLSVSDVGAHRHLGCSVGISGDRVIAGAYGGSTAYIFDANTGQELFKLLPSTGTPGDRYGYSVAISGNRAIVGAYLDDDAADDGGAAYIIDVATGQEILKLAASDGDSDDDFGKAVAIHGNLAIVGAPRADSDSGTLSTGAAYVFNVTTGQQLFKLCGSSEMVGDGFGGAVAIHGNRALVGADRGEGVAFATGTASIFDLTTGLETFRLVPPDGQSYDMFGYSVALGPDKAIVGAREDRDQGQYSGSAYVFDPVTGQELPKILPSNGHFGDRFGESIALSEGRLVAGVPLKYSVQNFRRGSAYIFCPDGVGTKYCIATPDAYGRTVSIVACGSASLAQSEFTLYGTGISYTTYMFFYGTGQGQIPFGNGFRCVTGHVRRLGPPRQTVREVALRVVDMASLGITPGTWNFQCWYRDPAVPGLGFNLSDGLSVTFVP